MIIIIPAKPFTESKSRLSSVLSVEQRVTLSCRLLRRTVCLARTVAEVVVVSRDQKVRKLAKQAGAWALVEAERGLNQAIQQGFDWVAARGGQAALILPADLPLLTQSDLTELMGLARRRPTVVIGPCHRGEGTNALLVSPPGVIPAEFGPASFARHCQAARAIGLEPIIYRSPTLAFDLDLPEDLETLKARAAAP